MHSRPVNGAAGGRSALAVLALLIALAALAGTAWMWWQERSLAGQEHDLAADLAAAVARLDNSDRSSSAQLDEMRRALEALAAADGGDALAGLRGEAAADRERLASLEQSLREQVVLSRSLQAAGDALHGRLSTAEAGLARLSARELDAATDLDLAEVDYLLRLASERLHLFADPAAADRTLEVAERHLAALENPALIGVRQSISAARRSLAQVALPDYLRLAADLDDLQAAIPRWSLAGVPGSAPAPGPAAETGWWARLKSTFASLVTVRRSTDSASELSLADQDYVRQRVWLQLEIAQLSLMRRDGQAFRAALTRVRDALAAWFDPADASVRSAERSLEGLAALQLDLDLPDITEPWTMLRLIRQAGPPADAGAAPAPLAEPGEQPR